MLIKPAINGKVSRTEVVPVVNTYVESRKRQFEEERGRQFTGGAGVFSGGSSFSSQQQQQQQQQGRFEECWLCGSCDHRRRDCPNRFTQTGEEGDGSQVFQRRVQCLGCRKIGHLVKDCPVRAGSALATSLLTESSDAMGSGGRGGEGSTRCYNCGGSHRLKECAEPKVGGGTSYATCFVCQQTGHIARSCPKNTHGIYVSGGSCKRCGSVEHLVSECPASREDSSSALSTSSAVIVKQDVKKRSSGDARGDDLEGNLAFGKDTQEGEEEGDEEDSSRKKKKSKKIRTL